MGRYTGSVCRLCRRAGVRLLLKGERCYSPKCAFERRGYPPGQHGQTRRKLSDFAVQLREKQKAERIYGLMEGQFRRYVTEAQKSKGVTGERLLQLLEMRLDNFVWRTGFAESRAQARQLVVHRHFNVDGRSVSRPGYTLRPGQMVELKPGSRSNPTVLRAREKAASRRVPSWLEVDPENMRGRVISAPRREEIDTDVQEQLIVEYYSR
jgi:small subunit ribosomal protein S4